MNDSKILFFTFVQVLQLCDVFSYFFQHPNVCKFTVKGTEYAGHSKETRSNKICQKWNSSIPHIVPSSIQDRHFPDGSKSAAKNYCRNPDSSETGPWCFTTSSTVYRESCRLSLCAYNSCQWTGLGMEYSGHKQVTILNNECMPWSLIKPSINESIFDMGFPDGNRMMAHKYCRNPTGDPVGPWCYVANLGFDLGLSQEYNKEYCDVPSCFDREDMFVVTETQDQYYTHFSKLVTDEHSLNISILLWQPDHWKRAELKLALTVLPTPADGLQIKKWNIGFEVIVKNNETGATPKEGEEPSWEPSPMILKGTDWVNLTLTWVNGFIAMKYAKDQKFVFLHEYAAEANSILGTRDWKIGYYSIVGSPAYINLYGEETKCEEHITYSSSSARYFSLHFDKLTRVLDFHLRANGRCIVRLKQSPMTNLLPEIVITIEGQDQLNTVVMKRHNMEDVILSSVPKFDMLSYWRWVPFTVTIVSSRLVLYIKKKTGIHSVFDVSDPIISTVRWFSFGSNETAHWTFYCSPDDYKIPDPQPPECSISNEDPEYAGHQWTTHSLKPCIPWIDESIKERETEFSLDGSKEKAMNYCRNPTLDLNGPYCYAYNLPYNWAIVKEHCLIRKCRLKGCRISGTATDFAGSISKTITNRSCQAWTSNSPHNIPSFLRTASSYPERDVAKAKNYCRDPSGDICGPWCYTTDPNFLFDLCDIPDCEYPDECTVLVTRVPNLKVYILPIWRLDGITFRAKIWVPAKNAGLAISLYPHEGHEYYKLSIGGDTNENISLHYYDTSDNPLLLKKVSLFHTLSAGRWTGFNLKFSQEKISLFYENVPKALFHWQFNNDSKIRKFNPVFLNYACSNYGYIGLNFKCDEKHIQISSKEKDWRVLYPLSVWLPENGPFLEELTFNFRGSSDVTLDMSTLPFLGPDVRMVINAGDFNDQISVKVKMKGEWKVVVVDRLAQPIFNNKTWTEIKIYMKETEIKIKRNGTIVSEWKNPRPLRVYFFNIISSGDAVTWVVNTEAPDLDAELRHGGWSHWSTWNCTVTCGGGKGIRYRTCTKPTPSIFGAPCIGPSMEIGICNQFQCGEMSPDLHEIINYRLRKYIYNIKIHNLQNLNVFCYQDVLEVLKEETPHYVFYWIFNDVIITPLTELQTLDIDKSSLHLSAANHNNTGVYACMVKNNSTLTKVLQITAVTVVTDYYTDTIREGQKYKLKCNNRVLEYFYGHLMQTWLLNGSEWKAFSKTSVGLIDYVPINSISKNLSGIWECKIYQDELNLSWTTNWIFLQVKQRPTFISDLLQDTFLGYLLGWINNEGVVIFILIAFFLLVVGATGFFTYYIIKIENPRLKKMFKPRVKYSRVAREETPADNPS